MTSSKLVGLRIDIETRSKTDIKRHGVYRYAEDPSFKSLIIGYSLLHEFVGGARKMGQPRPLALNNISEVRKFRDLIVDPTIEKHAFNAAFERICLSKTIGLPNGTYIDPENWHCAAIRANANGVFGTLDDVARALKSPVGKDAKGKALIKFFSVPIPSNSKHVCGCRTFHLPKKHPVEFAEFQDYCNQDVMAEAGVAALLPDIPAHVQAEYEADQRINDRGIRHFKALAEAAVSAVQVEKDRIMGELAVLTGLDNPNSGPQFNGWLSAPEQDYPMASLDKSHREDALADPFIPDHVRDALILKGAASLSSVTKHKAALNTRCEDGRIRGSLQFHGAHTGREAGRGIQPQNLPRYTASLSAISSLLNGTAGSEAPLIAKGSVRASLVPRKGHVFVTCDYNAIEARVLGWLCGEAWVEAEFRGAGKIYEATAEMMFGTPTKAQIIAGRKACGECGKDICLYCTTRSKGKVSNLALGYGGAAGALVTMGAEGAGIDIGNYKELHAEWKAKGMPGKFHEWERDRHDYPELMRIRDLYRDASPATVRFWKLCNMAFDMSSSGKGARFGQNNVLSMIRDGRHNRMVLPSGRSIWYRHAKSHQDPTRTGPNGEPRIDYRTFTGKSSGVGHMRTETHGGKLTENATQAVARDVLFDLIMQVEAFGPKYPAKTVLHVHDELVQEVPVKYAEQVLADTLGIMGSAPTWASGLVVKGEGKIMERYQK